MQLLHALLQLNNVKKSRKVSFCILIDLNCHKITVRGFIPGAFRHRAQVWHADKASQVLLLTTVF